MKNYLPALMPTLSPLFTFAAAAGIAAGHALASPAADIHLTARQQARLQLSVQKAGLVIKKNYTAFPAVVASDPGGIFVVSAPIDGKLQAIRGQRFPQLLSHVKANSPLVQVMPALSASELATLKLLLVKTQANLTAARLAAATAQAELKRDQTLYDSNQAVSLQTLENAQAALAQALSLYRSDRVIAAAVAAWLHGGKHTAGIPLMAPHTGRLIKIFAQPGQNILAGQKLYKIWDTRRLMVKIYLPLNYNLPSHFQLTTTVHGHRMLLPLVGIAGHASPLTGGAVMVAKLYGVRRLRPGMPKTVWLSSELQHPEHGYFVPQRAIVWWGGARWIFAKVSAIAFAPVRLVNSSPVPGGRFVPALPRNVRLMVVRGAQYLLSIEQSYSLKKSG